MSDKQPEYVTHDEAAAILGISKQELLQKYASQKIWAKNDGGIFKFVKSEVEDLHKELRSEVSKDDPLDETGSGSYDLEENDGTLQVGQQPSKAFDDDSLLDPTLPTDETKFGQLLDDIASNEGAVETQIPTGLDMPSGSEVTESIDEPMESMLPQYTPPPIDKGLNRRFWLSMAPILLLLAYALLAWFCIDVKETQPSHLVWVGHHLIWFIGAAAGWVLLLQVIYPAGVKLKDYCAWKAQQPKKPKKKKPPKKKQAKKPEPKAEKEPDVEQLDDEITINTNDNVLDDKQPDNTENKPKK